MGDKGKKDQEKRKKQKVKQQAAKTKKKEEIGHADNKKTAQNGKYKMLYS